MRSFVCVCLRRISCACMREASLEDMRRRYRAINTMSIVYINPSINYSGRAVAADSLSRAHKSIVRVGDQRESTLNAHFLSRRNTHTLCAVEVVIVVGLWCARPRSRWETSLVCDFFSGPLSRSPTRAHTRSHMCDGLEVICWVCCCCCCCAVQRTCCILFSGVVMHNKYVNEKDRGIRKLTGRLTNTLLLLNLSLVSSASHEFSSVF